MHEPNDGLDVPRGTRDRLCQLQHLIIEANRQQSLVAASTIEHFWSRHIVDCAQLVPLAPATGQWIDIGSGAGLPGLVVAVLRDAPILLAEPRRLRAEFLVSAARALHLTNVDVRQVRAQEISGPAAVISARAVAPLADLLAIAHHLATADTVWVLPRGRGAAGELAKAQETWHGRFRIVPSRTDPGAGIVVATHVSRGKR